MPWSKPCGGAWRRNATFLGQLATLALLSTLASWEPLGPNKGRTGLTNACAPGLPTRQSLCQTAIPALTPVTREQLLLPSCHCLGTGAQECTHPNHISKHTWGWGPVRAIPSKDGVGCRRQHSVSIRDKARQR